MLANQLLNDLITPLKTSDAAEKALSLMNDFKVSHLPIVNNTEFLGLISDEDIIELNDLKEPIGNHPLSLINPYVYENQHIYDVMRLMAEQQLTVVPVLDLKKNYLGTISINSLLNYYAEIASLASPGGILVLEVGQKDYSLSEIARIVESNDAHILSSYISSRPDSTKIEITLKIDKTDLSSIVLSFERFNYLVKSSYDQRSLTDDTMDRFDSFMNYLNI
jgi:acetoin utilization protein AcuB